MTALDHTNHDIARLDGRERTTHLASRAALDAPPPVRRTIGNVALNEVVLQGGVAFSALCSTMLLFGRLTPLSGKFGFAAVLFVTYLVTYAVVVSLSESFTVVKDRLMTVLLGASSVLAGGALLSVIVFTIKRALPALRHVNFYTEDLSQAGPLDPLSKGGLLHAMVGTLIMMAISLVLTVPLAITCAVYLTESRSRVAGLVRTIVTAMTALPSVLAGLFIFATWILILGMQKSGLAASIAVSIMMLPIIIRSADVVLRLVPGNLREASSALGAPLWRTVWHVVLPTARSGLTTSVILGVARGIGETAPVLLTAGYTASMNVNPSSNPMVSLPLASLFLVRSGQESLVARGFGAAALLMILVLVLFSIARVIGGRPAGHLSQRQMQRAAQRSIDDLRRCEQRAARRATPISLEDVR